MASRRSLLFAESGGAHGAAVGWAVGGRLLFPAVVMGLLAVFMLAPGSFEHKAHAALHGLCAQRPSHSFELGGRMLPFDARMTGIYGGFLGASAVFGWRRRFRGFRLPPKRVMVALGLFVAAMAIDGANSLLVDLGLWHAYAPDNGLRLATGLLTGIALATVLCFVLATTLWREGRREQAPIAGLGELGLVVAVQVPFALAALSGSRMLYFPVAALLLVAAVAVVAVLLLVVVVLVGGNEGGFERVGQLQVPATIALVAGVVVMAVFAGGRFLLERLTDAPPLT